MFEVLIKQGSLWKRVIDSIKDLVNEANFECNASGITIQAMDTAHVALVSLLLHGDKFTKYTCERNCVLGLNLASLSKILKCSESDDSITIRHQNDTDFITLVFDSPDGSKTSEYQMKLMEIESESMGIPELDYRAKVQLPSAEFAKICRDMNIFGDTVAINVTKEGVRFRAQGDIGEGSAFFKSTMSVDARRTAKEERVKEEKGVKAERTNIKAEREVDEDDEPLIPPPVKKQKTDEPRLTEGVIVEMNEPVTLSFALRYLNTFSKGSSLSERVNLKLAKDNPCQVEFQIDELGFLRYYLAPKVDDAEGA